MNLKSIFSYVQKTFDHVNGGVMVTNYAIKVIQASLRYQQTLHTPVTIYQIPGLLALDAKQKAILHRPGDVVKCKQWDLTYQKPHYCKLYVRVVSSWINIRDYTDMLNTQFSVFIEVHWMAVAMCQAANIKKSYCHTELLT